MNTNEFLPLYDYINSIPAPETPEEIAAVSYSNLLDDLSFALIGYRLDHQLNQTQLAEALNCSQGLISSYERGSRNISAETLCTLLSKIGKKVRLSIEDVNSIPVSKSSQDPVYPDSNMDAKYALAG